MQNNPIEYLIPGVATEDDIVDKINELAAIINRDIYNVVN
jgi:hypothetical protein